MDEIIALVDEARAVEDETHTDLCVITRGGEPSWDPINGEQSGTATRIVPPAGSEADAAPCRIRMPSRLASKEEAGEHLWSLSDAILRLSASEPGVGDIQKDDTVTITSTVRGVSLTKAFTIVAAVEGSHMSGARFVIRRGE